MSDKPKVPSAPFVAAGAQSLTYVAVSGEAPKETPGTTLITWESHKAVVFLAQRLQAENKQMREWLRVYCASYDKICPQCREWEHNPDCALAAMLGEGQE